MSVNEKSLSSNDSAVEFDRLDLYNSNFCRLICSL